MSFDPLPDAGKLRELALQTMRGKGKRRRTDAADALAVEALVSLPPSSPPSLPISIPQEMVPESTNPDDVAISPLEPINNPPSSRSDCEDGEIVEDSRAGTSTPIPPQHPATLPPYLDPFINRESPHPDEIARPGYLDLTERQLQEVKDNILDLLAHDFPSENLSTLLGLDPTLIAICFIELHLRLPSNLRIEEIPPLPHGTPLPSSLAHLPEHLVPRRPPITPQTLHKSPSPIITPILPTVCTPLPPPPEPSTLPPKPLSAAAAPFVPKQPNPPGLPLSTLHLELGTTAVPMQIGSSLVQDAPQVPEPEPAVPPVNAKEAALRRQLLARKSKLVLDQDAQTSAVPTAPMPSLANLPRNTEYFVVPPPMSMDTIPPPPLEVRPSSPAHSASRTTSIISIISTTIQTTQSQIDQSIESQSILPPPPKEVTLQNLRSQSPQVSTTDPLINKNGKRLRATDLFQDDFSPTAPSSPVTTRTGSSQDSTTLVSVSKRSLTFKPVFRANSSLSETIALGKKPQTWPSHVIEMSDSEDSEDINSETYSDTSNQMEVIDTAKLEGDVMGILEGAVASIPSPAPRTNSPLTSISPPMTTTPSETAHVYEKRLADLALLKAMIAKRQAKPKSVHVSQILATTPVSTPLGHTAELAARSDDGTPMDDIHMQYDEGHQETNSPHALEDHDYIGRADANEETSHQEEPLDDKLDGHNELAVIGSVEMDTPTEDLRDKEHDAMVQDDHNSILIDTRSRFQAYHPSNMSPFSQHLPSSTIETRSRTLDLLPLKQTVLERLDPTKAICKFEIPGGGTCLDPKCGDVHVRDLEPSDAETAQFLSAAFPSRRITEFTAALLALRQKSLPSFNARMELVLRVLSLR